jgi:hypothetical protein
MSRRLLMLLAVAALALMVAQGATADQSYTDANGDGRSGTDITTLTVRNDPAGNISIQVASASPIVANHAIAIFIDADKNQATGDQGDDYWMYGGPAVGVGFFAWNGSDFVRTNPPDFQVGAASSNVTDFRFSKADIGNVSSFNFVAISISIDPPNINFWDAAPDTGYFTYNLAAPPPPPPPPPPPTVALGAATSPAGVHAGKAFTISAPVRTTASAVKVACTAKVGGLTLHPRGTYAKGRAACTAVAPRTSVGKRLTGTITATVSGAKATRAFSLAVRR